MIPGRVARGGLTGISAAVLFAASGIPAWASEPMSLTFVRQGQSLGNTSGTTDTSIPGPPLTPLGLRQANDAAVELALNGYTAIHVSQAIATQQTAVPLSAALGIPIHQPLLGGLNEIGAGIFEGTPEIVGAAGIQLFTAPWVLGNSYARIPGSVDGFEFNGNVNSAIQQIYDDRDVDNPKSVAFSDLDTIRTWTAMNVKNPALLVMFLDPLDYTDRAVITGSPEDGWTLVEWNGVAISPEPTLPMKLFIDTRTLNMQISDSAAAIGEAFLTFNPTVIVTAIAQGAVDITEATVQWAKAVVNDIIGSVTDTIGSTPNQLVNTDRTAASAVAADGAVEPEVAEPPTSEPEQAAAGESTEASDDASAAELIAGNRSGDRRDDTKASRGELTDTPSDGPSLDALPAVKDDVQGVQDQLTTSIQTAGDSKIAGGADGTVDSRSDGSRGADAEQNAA